MSLREALKHAFHVDLPGAAEPDERTADIVDRVCRSIVKRGMSTPALMALEMSRPLNFVAAQAMHIVQPAAELVLDTESFKQFALFLEQRGSIEYLCDRLQAHADGDVEHVAEKAGTAPGHAS
ncbi:MAG: hypothetical protein MK074_00985 [Phycisphaerales bacterium]|nr:hypothetical protein [Phycisphaerales bacterium]